MKYTVDEIETDIVKLIDLDGNVKFENIENIGFDIKESDVLVFENNTYKKDDEEKENRLNRIKELMEKLRKD